MRNEVQRLSLLSYVQAFFPSNFEVTLRRSFKDPDDRVLTVRDVITGNAAAYEGSALSILDICSMGSIAENLCGRLSDQAAGRKKVMK
ncbi:hypothetical protein [Pseudomonas sp. LA5]|uniref:hypothetical protein n=1 Tax=Pseudomonas sp. LA5 TaxID=3027850 RepID=UPI002362D022|nr:hypothetical protein [Pseudomonas sp. LA5]